MTSSPSHHLYNLRLRQSCNLYEWIEFWLIWFKALTGLLKKMKFKTFDLEGGVVGGQYNFSDSPSKKMDFHWDLGLW